MLVGIGVSVGPKNCPGPQPDIVKLIIKIKMNIVCCLVFIFLLCYHGATGSYSSESQNFYDVRHAPNGGQPASAGFGGKSYQTSNLPLGQTPRKWARESVLFRCTGFVGRVFSDILMEYFSNGIKNPNICIREEKTILSDPEAGTGGDRIWARTGIIIEYRFI